MDFAYLFTMWIITSTLFAIGIKITKRWYLQRQENMEISRRKTRLEVQFQKASIQPAFLFEALDNISVQIDTDNDKAAGMVLDLADILSYSLYDGDLELVPFDIELGMLRQYIKLQHNCNHNILAKVSAEQEVLETYIAPMSLVMMLQECIWAIRITEDQKGIISLYAGITDDRLSVTASFTIDLQFTGLLLQRLQKASERLHHLFLSGRYHVTAAKEGNLCTLVLDVPLIIDPDHEQEELVIINRQSV